MNIQELEVVRRLNLPIKFFVLNNNGYVSIRNTQETHFDKRFVASGENSGLTLPSLQRNAQAYEIPYRRLETTEDLEAIDGILEQEGPLICEVMLPETHVTAPKASVYKTKDGQFMAKPMEDLAPFLDRDEFRANMFIETVND
jgi:acetolactate synthase-1/2/3 large subunit